ncbi:MULTISPECIES: hypothetical protein [Haloferax]|uniref:Uncharacterized protein n=1 Tax=Haloferax massiliensis TaxID=1476858 RepID=A0A0D6JR70_9EURY|nr:MULTISPECIES: hypothetical protein [Haloferax]MDS0240261.1 hypothetical protein [Haloferax sp. S2CR25]MDS0443382.1 hypothetical protein [Haloferax sp. S2CR25-2]CQR50377.1 hypothetical protein BN996_01857 [Haloferax massiliensis]
MTRRRDAALAGAMFVPVAAAAVLLRPPVTAEPVFVGVVGALALEIALSVRASSVRKLWERRGVRVASVALAIVGTALGVVAFGPTSLLVVAAGLSTYLLLLGVVELRSRRFGPE